MTSTDKELRERFERWGKGVAFYPILDQLTDNFCFRAYEAGHAEAQAEIEALRKDAERYRYLCSKLFSDHERPFSVTRRIDDQSDEYFTDKLGLDAEIDDAMASEVKS